MFTSKSPSSPLTSTGSAVSLSLSNLHFRAQNSTKPIRPIIPCCTVTSEVPCGNLSSAHDNGFLNEKKRKNTALLDPGYIPDLGVGTTEGAVRQGGGRQGRASLNRRAPAYAANEASMRDRISLSPGGVVGYFQFCSWGCPGVAARHAGSHRVFVGRPRRRQVCVTGGLGELPFVVATAERANDGDRNLNRTSNTGRTDGTER
ncbi:hypothetical protein EDB84DRAFT_525744 [Lactarius hengduanensis]|nr:hypothetical protein EDB84DRAFT_525744 [Lactarius hengduanensis]